MNITALQTSLTGRLSDSRKKLPVYINDKDTNQVDCVILFRTGNAEWVSASKAPYYNEEIQVAIRHADYDRARSLAFEALEYINANRKVESGGYFIPESVPVYAGQDDRSGFIWTFNISIKGGNQ